VFDKIKIDFRKPGVCYYAFVLNAFAYFVVALTHLLKINKEKRNNE